MAARGQPVAQRAAYGDHVGGGVDPPLHASDGGLPGRRGQEREVLAAGAPDRLRLRRPQPDVQLPAAIGVRIEPAYE